MENIIQKIKGSDVISKSYDIINKNFDALYELINVLSNILDRINENGINGINSLEYNDGRFIITTDNGNEIVSNEIPLSSKLTKGLLSNFSQIIFGDKIFNDSVIVKNIKGPNGQSIIKAYDNDIFIGDEKGKAIILKYDSYGNFIEMNIQGSNGTSTPINIEELKQSLIDYLNGEVEIFSSELIGISKALADLSNQIDRVVTYWYGTDAITDKNYSSNSKEEHHRPWKDTDNNKDSNHVGDFYIDETNRLCYLYKENNEVYSWSLLSEEEYPAVVKALLESIGAKATLDGKLNVFYGKPKGAYNQGDLWVVTKEDVDDLGDGNPFKIGKNNSEVANVGEYLYSNEDRDADSFEIEDWTHMVTYVNGNDLNGILDKAVQEILKNQKDSNVTVWQIDGFENTLEKTELELINESKDDKVNRPWKSDGDENNNDDELHLNDILYSKKSKKYYEFVKNTKNNYVWVDAINNIFVTLNELNQKVGMDDNNRRFIIATRYEMLTGDDKTLHSKGDIWVVDVDENDNKKIEDVKKSIYKNILIGGFYMCAGADSVHDGKNEETWKLLVDYDSIVEEKINSSETLKTTISKADNANTYIEYATNDGVITITEKIQLRKEWYNISGQQSVNINVDEKYNSGSFGKALESLKKINDYTSYKDNIIGKFNALMNFLKDKIKLYENVHTNISNDDKNIFLKVFNEYYLSEQDIYSKISGVAIDDAKQALEIANGVVAGTDSELLNSFDIEEKVAIEGSAEKLGGLSLTNLLYVKDLNNIVTGGLSGVGEDNVGLFLGCEYEQAFGAANWDKLSDTNKQYYIEKYKGKPNVPVLLTKTGKGSNIGGCYLDDVTDKLMVPVENIAGEIKCKSLKADNDSKNPNDAEATVTPNAFRIKYGNAFIEISLIDGIPTIIGVDKDGKSVWSLGAGNTDSAMYNLIYNITFGNINYKNGVKNDSGWNNELDTILSTINTQLPTCKIVNKYTPAYNSKDVTAYKILPLKTRMRYKIGNKFKYFSYDVVQKCPYYCEIIDCLLGYPHHDYEKGTKASILYHEVMENNKDDKEDGKITKFINERYNLNLKNSDITNDVFGRHINGKYEHIADYATNVHCIEKHSMKYKEYYLDYCKTNTYYLSTMCDFFNNINIFEKNDTVSAGNVKYMDFHNDYTTISEDEEIAAKEWFLQHYTTNSKSSIYEVNVYNQNGSYRSIIPCVPQKYNGGTEYTPGYIVTRENKDKDKWDKYLEEYYIKTGCKKEEFDKDGRYSNCNLLVFELQDGLPSPRTLNELTFASWWYSLNSIRSAIDINDGSYNHLYDDYYPRIFDISSEIEIFDTGAGIEICSELKDFSSMILTNQKQKYTIDTLYNILEKDENANQLTKYYRDLKILSVDCNNSNILSYNTKSSSPINYRLSIFESFNDDTYIISRIGDEIKYLLNDRPIESYELPNELDEYFNKTDFITFKLVKSNKEDIIDKTYLETFGEIKFYNNNESTIEDILDIKINVKPPTNETDSSGTIGFDISTMLELETSIKVRRLYKEESITKYQDPSNSIDPIDSIDNSKQKVV